MEQQVLERTVVWPKPVPEGATIGGRLRVVRTLGRGSRSVVYAVWHPDDWTAMACKVLLPPWDRDPRAIEQLLREGERLTALAHPAIVRLFEVNCAADPPFLLMELLDGPDLAALLARRGRLTVTAAATMAAEIGGALAHLHRHGWLHLDLKPRNIVYHQGRARLVDLGISRNVGRRPGPGRTSGTAGYMAPEQQSGGRPLTPATDIFALGLVLFEALTGMRAFPAAGELTVSDLAALRRFPLAGQRARALRDVRPRAPQSLAALVAACLEPHPADRPESMTEVLEELLPFAAPSIGAGAAIAPPVRRSA